MPEPKMNYQQIEYDALNKSVKTIMDLTSRIDERVKILIEQQNDNNQKIERVIEKNQDMSSRISILESKDINNIKNKVEAIDIDLTRKIEAIDKKLIALELFVSQHNGTWTFVTDAAFKIFMLIITIILSIKLGINF